MKTCFKCKTDQPLTEFYRHSAMADGHLNKCKSCTKNDATTHRNAHIDKIREYDRERGKLPHRVASTVEANRKFREKHKQITRAHNLMRRCPELQAKQPCCRCGADKTFGHHENYWQPTRIAYLCQPCHKQRHKELKAAGLDPIARLLANPDGPEDRTIEIIKV